MKPLPVIVDNRVRVCIEGVSATVVREIKRTFEHVNPSHAMKRKLGIPAWGEPPVIRTWKEGGETNEPWLSLPRGGFSRVREALEEAGHDIHVTDAREHGVPADIPDHKRELYIHQTKIVRAAIEREQCIIRAPTGSGKTSALIAIAAELSIPTLVVVHSQALLDQWTDRVQSELGLRPRQIGIVQGKRFNLKPITLSIQKTMAKVAAESEEVRNFFGCVIADECFEGSTSVLMEDGLLRQIADIKIGDHVAVGGEVLGVSRKSAVCEWTLADSLVTAEHPVAVYGVGWVSVSSICDDDVVWYDPVHELRALREDTAFPQPEGEVQEPRHRTVRCKRAVPSVWEEGRDSLARLARLDEVRDWPLEQGAHGGDVGGDATRGRSPDWAEAPDSLSEVHRSLGGCQETGAVDSLVVEGPRASFFSRGGEGSVQGSGVEAHRGGQDPTVWWSGTRQRRRPDQLGSGDGAATLEERIRRAVRGFNREAEAVPTALQDRPCSSSGARRGGVGWVESFEVEAHKRRAQDILPRIEGLEGSSLPWGVQLRRGGVRVRRCFPVAAEVHNLETEGGVYVAAGVLVHNCHMFAAKTFFQCIDPFPARYRIGASADHKRRDRKEFLIHDLFGDVAADIDRESLIESGHVLDVEIRAVLTRFTADWYGIPEEDEHNTRDEKKHIDFVRLAKEMAEDPERNWQVIRLVREEVQKGDQVLVMAHEREHCMRLGQTLHGMGTKVGYLLGGAESRSEFRATSEGLKNGKVRVGVGTYKAIGTGIDLPRVGVAVAVTPISGNKQNFGQVRGRVCRTSEGKTGARLYVMLDHLVYPHHIKNLIAWNTEVFVRGVETGDWTPARHWMKATA